MEPGPHSAAESSTATSAANTTSSTIYTAAPCDAKETCVETSLCAAASVRRLAWCDEPDDDTNTYADEPDDSSSRAPVGPASKKRCTREYFREYYRRRHPFRPVFANDLRRKMGLMWVNTLNSHDPALVRSFLRTFSVQDCVHVKDFPPDYASVLPTLKPLATMEQTVLHSAYLALTVPDLAVQMPACRVVQTANQSGSKLVMRMRYAGTIVYQVPAAVLPLLCDGPASDAAGSRHYKDEGGDGDACAIFPALRKMVVPVERPIALGAEVACVFTLDEQHRISAWELRYDLMWATPMEAPGCPPLLRPLPLPLPMPLPRPTVPVAPASALCLAALHAAPAPSPASALIPTSTVRGDGDGWLDLLHDIVP